MTNRPTVDFKDVLSESGIPTTEAALEAKLKEEVVGAGSLISNDSTMSPFWSWVRAVIITPTVWLINTLLVGYVLPNMFVATAARWALELKAWELNVTIKGAVKTQGVITLTKTNAADLVTVAKGSIIQTLPIDGITYQMQVLEDTTLTAGLETAEVLVEALAAGAAYNLSAGYFNVLPVELPGVVSAVNGPDWIEVLGADAESDDELALRLQNAFTSSGNWHIDDAYRSIIASVAGINAKNIYFENTGHIIPGSATAYIVMDVGETPMAILEQLNTYIMTDGHHGHGDVLTCSAMPDRLYDVIADIVLIDNVDEAQITITMMAVENRIRAAFKETAAFPEMQRAEPNSRFSMSKLGTDIHNNMALIQSISLRIDEVIQHDVISLLEQPRINTLLVQEAV